MHPGEPCASKVRADALPKDHKRDEREIVGEQDPCEDASNDGSVSAFDHPVQQIETEREGDDLLADAPDIILAMIWSEDVARRTYMAISISEVFAM